MCFIWDLISWPVRKIFVFQRNNDNNKTKDNNNDIIKNNNNDILLEYQNLGVIIENRDVYIVKDWSN